METINNMAAAAAKAVWGEDQKHDNDKQVVNDPTVPSSTKIEPVSGVQGDTSRGQPFDAGNMTPSAAPIPKESPFVQEKEAAPKATTGTHESSDNVLGQNPTEATQTTQTTGKSAEIIGADSKPTAQTEDKAEDKTGTMAESKTESKTKSEDKTDVQSEKPSHEHAHSSDATTFRISVPKADATKPHIDPDVPRAGGEADSSAPSHPGEASETAGPRPIAVLARERGGDAGNVSSNSPGANADSSTADSSKPDSEKDTTKSSGLQSSEAKSKGTGEEYVKSSGLQANGGDFSAANPGAGKEADRILEERGLGSVGKLADANSETKSETKSDTGSDDAGGRGHSKRASIGARIKAKFHHKDKDSKE